MEPATEKFVIQNHVFIKPDKAIKAMKDMNLWERSIAYKEFMTFVLQMNEAIKGKSLSVDFHISDIAQKLFNLIEKLNQIMVEHPPIEQPQRFGNKAFRNWFETVKNKSNDLLKEVLPLEYHSCIPEIVVYFEESFGNSTRIDYGTGHEASFVMFLCCLYKIGLLNENDRVATVSVFFRYLELVRNLQQRYKMEPAGSHGVWSLDDFQFIPFIWGSSQLMENNNVIEPSKFLDENILSKYGKDYMFLSCIQYIMRVKTGLFAEHSNQLWGISGVSSWAKINQGLIKMYTKEVLGKFPVVQHMLFGSLLSVQTAPVPFKLMI